MVQKTNSARLSIIFLLILLVPNLCGADVRQETEKELRNHYEDNIYILRNFYTGDNLKYSPEGTLISGGEPGIWSLNGFIKIDKINVKKDKIELKGYRLLWSYDQQAKRTVYYLSRSIKIEIGPYDTLPDLSSSFEVIQNVFLKKNEFHELVPVYWKNFVQKVFEDGNSPDDVATDNKSSAPPRTDSTNPKEQKMGVVIKSKLIKRVTPEYPELAKRLKVSGIVILRVEVDEEGIPTVRDIIHPIGIGLEESAIDAVSRWRYSPTYLDGKPITVTATVTVNFVLGR